MSGIGGSLLEGLDQAFQGFGQWDPENATEIDSTLLGIPDAFKTGFTAMNAMAARLQEESDVHPLVRAEIEQAAATLSEIAESFQQVYAQHRIQHGDQMDRIEQQRPGAEKWDVSRNR